MPADHQKTRANYDRLSRWYDLFSGSSERTVRRRGLQMLAVKPGECVLEIGCGTGESLPALAFCVGRIGQVIGIDLSSGMLSMAKSKLMRFASSNVTLVQGDSFQLPFVDGTFDAVFMSFTLELFAIAEIPVVLYECKRILRSAGRMGIVSLLKRERPRVIEKLYTRAHLLWPTVIDCQPIPLFNVLRKSGLTACEADERSMWGLTIGLAIAHSS
ncbi:MAG: methyltransferase domain-containing protein [Anaerolineales bacterium]|nr:methyltransferase domain-containing protein [Anaerolineales bacterium]